MTRMTVVLVVLVVRLSVTPSAHFLFGMWCNTCRIPVEVEVEVVMTGGKWGDR